jgi:hypothetical protein
MQTHISNTESAPWSIFLFESSRINPQRPYQA